MERGKSNLQNIDDKEYFFNVITDLTGNQRDKLF